MDHRLVAEVDLSSSPSDPTRIEADIRGLAAQAIERTVGSRGEGRVSDLHVIGTRLEITIESNGVRPHQTLLSLVRRISEDLGRTAKIGVRGIRARSYRVTFEVDSVPGHPVTLPIPYALTFTGKRATLELKGLPEEGLRDNWMDRAVQLVLEKIRRQTYQGKEQFWALLSQSPAREVTYHDDPTEDLLRRHWVRAGPTKGKWFLGPRATHLLRTMERIALHEVLQPLGFQEVTQPHHDSFDVLLRTGHLEGVPNEFYYVVEPRTREPQTWERFSDLVAITRQVPEEELKTLVTGPTAVLCYAQCPTIYWWLSGRTLSERDLPLKVFDRTAVSNRYESGGRHGLERVDEFHRIEPVYVGTPAQLADLRARLLERYAHVFDDILELDWRTAWVTPFYLQQSGGVGLEDEEERVRGTIDFEAYLPYRGPRDRSEWLEFQNLSVVGTRFTKAFTIRSPREELWSGCSGIGLERWLTAFLAQKGPEPDGWPVRFRDYVGDLPRELEFL